LLSCSQWEGPSMHSRCLAFFPFLFLGGGRFFFHVSQFPNVFALCSFQVPNMFPSFAMFSPFSIPPHFYPICLEKWCPPFTYIVVSISTLLLITWPQWTSTHHRTIHCMPIITQLWMNLNWVNIWFHLGNQFCSKSVTYIGR